MDVKQIQELIKLVNETNLSELKVEYKDFKLSLRTKFYTEAIKQGKQQTPIITSTSPIVTPQNIQQVPSNIPNPISNNVSTIPETKKEEKSTPSANIKVIKSPMIGTFYRSSAPDKPPYVKIGQTVAQKDVLCIIEAMKLFNEIEAEISGRIVKVLVEDNTPVEYEQPLFEVEVLD